MLPDDIKEQLKSIILSGISKNTLKSYSKDLKYLWAWAKLRLNVDEAYPIDLAMILTFLTDHFVKMPESVENALVQTGIKKKMGPLKYSTIKRRLFTISAFHTKQGLKNPCKHRMVIEVMQKAKRSFPQLSR